MSEDRENKGAREAPEPPDPSPEPIELPEEPGQPGEEPEEPREIDELEELEPIENDEGDDSLAVDSSGLGEPSAAPTPAEAPWSPAEEAGDLRKKVEEKHSQLAQVMKAYRSLKKETEKLRKRAEQQQKRRFEQSKNDFIGRFVEVLDNLDRAIDSIENNFDSDSVLEGIILVRSRLVQLLREEGLEKIFVGGQPFDPTHSEAAAIEPVDDDSQDNVVIKELQRGYMLKGALLRPARVVVGRFSHADGDKASESTPGPSPAEPAPSGSPGPTVEDDRSDQ